jgi:hypothetical protein
VEPALVVEELVLVPLLAPAPEEEAVVPPVPDAVVPAAPVPVMAGVVDEAAQAGARARAGTKAASVRSPAAERAVDRIGAIAPRIVESGERARCRPRV